MSCINCGSPFHEIWDCTKPRKPSTAARKDVQNGRIPDEAAPPKPESASPEIALPAGPAGTQAPPVDTKIVGKRRGRPQTITDMKAYKAEHERNRRAALKANANPDR